MPKHRGVEVKVVSQFETIKEYSPQDSNDSFNNDLSTLKSDSNNTVSVYIPVQKGSQFWLKYAVDGPHPPEAVYFFKMKLNDQTITSWDTTQELAFQGKAVVALQYVGDDPFTKQPVMQRNVFRFSSYPEEVIDAFDDCIEVSMYRVEHRRRLKLAASKDPEVEITANDTNDMMSLHNGGISEALGSQKYYQYQLLDPLDVPHVRFRFYMRTEEQLNELGYGHAESTSSMTSFDSSSSGENANDDTTTTSASYRSSLDSVTKSTTAVIPKVDYTNKPAPLTLSLDGVEFDVSHKAAKPLSPPTAPAHITSFGIKDDIVVEKKNKRPTAKKVRMGGYQKSSKAARAGAAMLLGGLIERAKGRKVNNAASHRGLAAVQF